MAEAPSQFLETLQTGTLQDMIVAVRGHAGQMTVEVKAEDLHEFVKTLKQMYGFNYLSDITGTDNYTDEARFEVTYNLANLETRQRLLVCCRVEEEDPVVDTIVDLWKSADWYEREVYDMMGIKFKGHPDLRRIYMPEDFEWFPLRKEFPLLGIPGSIPLPEKDPPKSYK
jgi:NADH-quinone oxidoreductase subunit C